MAKYTGNKGTVKVGGVTYCTTSWELTETVEAIDVTCQSATAPTAHSYISNGLRDAEGTFTLDMTSTTAAIRPTVTNSVAFELSDSRHKFTGNCLITSVSRTVAVGEKVSSTVNIKVTGDVTVATV